MKKLEVRRQGDMALWKRFLSVPTTAALLLAFPLAGCTPLAFSAGQPKSNQPAGNDGSWRYTIAPDDLLDVHVVDVSELSGEYRVSPDGTIILPLLELPILAEGLAPCELSAAIAGRLRDSGIVTHANVVVTVKSSRLHSVAIVGAVNKPQIYPLFGATSVLDVLSQAEGLSKDAGNTLIITRGGIPPATPRHDTTAGDQQEGAPTTLKVNLKRLLETGDPSLNLTVYPGDRVTVERAGIVYVVGAVNRPGGFPIESNRTEMSVLQALALGEGLKSTALEKKTMIIRRGPQFPMGRKEIEVNLKRILAGHEADPGLKPDDILFIPESGSKIALQRGAEAAIQVATGVIIWRR